MNDTTVSHSDLTTYARIRIAALEGFARQGVAATSIRDVAAAAGVSPGLVQHHFTSKADLRQAVDDHVVSLFAEAFDGMGEGDDGLDLFTETAERITRLVDDSPNALRYVAGSIAEGHESGLATFDRFLEIADGVIARMAEQGYLRAGMDLQWIALHGVIFNLATVLFEPAISRHLPRPFSTPGETERWSEATTDLFARGMLAAPGET